MMGTCDFASPKHTGMTGQAKRLLTEIRKLSQTVSLPSSPTVTNKPLTSLKKRPPQAPLSRSRVLEVITSPKCGLGWLLNGKDMTEAKWTIFM